MQRLRKKGGISIQKDQKSSEKIVGCKTSKPDE
jgi:hypothetical protein